MTAHHFALINHSDVPQSEIDLFVPAATRFMTEHLGTCWISTAGSTIRQAAQADSFVPLVLAPTTTVADSLGYHSLDAGPIAIVEIDACRRYNQPWTIAATHEIAELLVNPRLDRFVSVGLRRYPLEVADPVTGDYYEIDGVSVTNFTMPSYWILDAGRYDFMARVTTALPNIPHNGWIEWEEDGSYQNAWGADLSPRQIAYLAERHGRRYQIRHMNNGVGRLCVQLVS